MKEKDKIVKSQVAGVGNVGGMKREEEGKEGYGEMKGKVTWVSRKQCKKDGSVTSHTCTGQRGGSAIFPAATPDTMRERERE